MEGKEIKSIEVNLKYDLTAGNFVSKIQEIRQKLAVTHTRNRPVLPTTLDEKKPDFLKKVTWFDIVLASDIAPKNRVRLRIRCDTLYLQGFRVNEANNWFELGDKHFIDPKSTLVYGHNYNDLLKAAGFNPVDGLRPITVGRKKLINAVDLIANDKNVKKRAEALLIVIVMFCESSRFIPIQNFMRRTWQKEEQEQKGVHVPDWISTLVRRWGELSGCVLFYDAHPTYKWEPQKLIVEGPAPKYEPIMVEARSVDELLEYLGILQRDPATIKPPKA